MKISVVVPAFNEERLLGETLRKIKMAMDVFARRGWQTELVVCDNNSTDRTAEIARAADAIVVFEAVNQIARARNCGAAAATGDWLIFVDADSHPSAELFDDAAVAIQSDKYLGGSATMQLDEKYFFAGIVARLWNLTSRWKKFFAGAFMFCEVNAFRKLGGFGQEFFCAEEVDFGLRLKKMAKESGKRLAILHRHSLLTSARKMRLYSTREHLSMLFKIMFNSRHAMRSREQAHLWYDGRR